MLCTTCFCTVRSWTTETAARMKQLDVALASCWLSVTAPSVPLEVQTTSASICSVGYVGNSAAVLCTATAVVSEEPVSQLLCCQLADVGKAFCNTNNVCWCCIPWTSLPCWS